MVLDLIKGFFCIYQVVFVFASIDVLYDIYRFAYVEPLLHPWDEADLVVVNDLSDMLLDSVLHTHLMHNRELLLRVVEGKNDSDSAHYLPA
jgi:hypothetical protein